MEEKRAEAEARRREVTDVIAKKTALGFHFGHMPTDLTSVVVYRVTNGKIARLMLLS